VAQLRAALATAVGAKQALLAQKPHEFNPQFHQHLTQLDQQVQNLETQIQQYGNQPQYANYLPQWRAQIAPLQQQKAELLKGGPAAFAKQQYEARVTQLDQQIAGVENNINGYPGANYAPQRAQWKTQLDDFRKIKKAIVAMGPEAYSAEYEQKLTAATQAVSQAKTNVQTTTWNFDAQLAAVQREAKLADALKAELAKHGALRYNPHYEQRLAQLDQQNGQLESYIASPQYGRDQKAQWRAQIAQNEKIRDDLMASGPDNYSPYEPQIQGLRQQIEQHRAAMAPLKQQIEIADAAANKGAAIEDKFAAISDQVLMGAPPGGGVAEAVHKPAAK
jgi:chromosome segregation ATPase